MKICKICGNVANTDRLLCKECYRLQRNGHAGKTTPIGREFVHNNKRYIITEDAKVFSTVTYKYLTPTVMRNGYIMHSFGSASNGTRRQIYAHRLVAYCYGLLPTLNSNLVVDHVDSNRSNNALHNLRVVPSSDNELFKRQKNGLLFAHTDCEKFGPYKSVKQMYEALNIKGTLGSFYTQVSRGQGYGFIFTRENIEVTTDCNES